MGKISSEKVISFFISLIILLIVLPAIDKYDFSKYYPLSLFYLCLLITMIGLFYLIIQWKEHNMNITDSILLSVGCIALLQIEYKTIFIFYSKAWFFLFCCTLIIGLIRFIKIYENKYKIYKTDFEVEKYKPSDLKYILDNNIPLGLLTEYAVDYDLLNRDFWIEKVETAIYNSKYIPNLTVSITGEWGSGKTTIIKNALKKIKSYSPEEFIIIEDFDPRQYGDETTLIQSLLEEMLITVGVTNIYERNKYKKAVLATLTSMTGVQLSLFMNNERQLLCMKDRIEALLKEKDKRLIIVIDNLERIEAEYVLRILKIISTTLNLKGVTYVLVYDDIEMVKIFKSLKINSDYIEKIVQLVIPIPNVEQSILNYTFIEKAEKHGFIFNSLEKEEILEMLNKYIINIRQYKRFINSIFFLIKNIEMLSLLNHRDVLLFELLQFKEPNLYNNVVKNPQKYISVKSNEKTTGDDNPLISMIFQNHSEKSNKYHEITASQVYRINELPYFNAYKNYFLKTSIERWEPIRHFVNLVCMEDSGEKIEKEYFKIMNFTKSDNTKNNYLWIDNNQEDILMTISMMITTMIDSTFISRNIFELIKSIIKFNYLYNDDNTAVYLGDIVGRMIEQLNSDEFNKICEHVEEDYKNIYMYNRMYNKSALIQKRNGFEIAFKKLVRNCIDRNIDIFSKENYHRNNSYILEYRNVDLIRNDPQVYWKYINNLLDKNKEYIFFFLLDWLKNINLKNTIQYTYSETKDGEITFKKYLEMQKLSGMMTNIEKQRQLNETEKLLKELFEKEIIQDNREDPIERREKVNYVNDIILKDYTY